MNKAERIAKKEADAIVAEKEMRHTMEIYVINDYQPIGKPHFRKFKEKAWTDKVSNMTIKELVKEFEMRDGPEWLEYQNLDKRPYPGTKADIG